MKLTIRDLLRFCESVDQVCISNLVVGNQHVLSQSLSDIYAERDVGTLDESIADQMAELKDALEHLRAFARELRDIEVSISVP